MFHPQIKATFIILITLLFSIGCAGLLGPDIRPAIKLTEEGDHAGALAHYQTIIDADKANAKVYRLAYESAFNTGKRITAAKYYDLALETGFSADSMRSLAIDLWYTRALMVMGKDQWEEARKATEQLKQLDAKSKESRFCSLIMAGKKKFDRGAHKGLWDAVNDYTKASVLDPTTGLPHYLMGMARFKNNRTDYDAALEDYYEALKVEPDGLFADRARADIKKIEATKAKMKAFWGK